MSAQKGDLPRFSEEWERLHRSGTPKPLHRPPPRLTWEFFIQAPPGSGGFPLTVEGSGVQWSAMAEPGGSAGPGGTVRGGKGWMSMFLGTHTPRLDEKGRLILPAKFRDELAGGVVVTKGQERCLYVFPGAEFARIAEQLRATPMTNKAARAYGRVFFASAHDEVPDRQGRVTIPQHLREYAGLDRDLVVIGASTRVEIWDRQAWDTYLAESEEDFAGIEEGVLPGGL